MCLRRCLSKESRARDLFYALWVPDLFMKRVEEEVIGRSSALMNAPASSTATARSLTRSTYSTRGRVRRGRLPAQQLWLKIVEAQMETGTPYMLYKDSANHKSNQKHLGVIRGSNLCTEIIEYTSEDEVAVCNLASLALPRFVVSSGDGSSSGGSGQKRVSILTPFARSPNL